MSVGMASKPRFGFGGFRVVAEIEFLAAWQYKTNRIGEWLLHPLLTLTFLTAGLEGLSGQGDRYISFVLPGLLALDSMHDMSISIYRNSSMRSNGQLALRRLTGVGSSGFVLGMSAMNALAFLMKAAIMIPVAVLLGASAPWHGWLLTLVVGLIAVMFWAGMAVVITSVAKTYQSRDLFMTFGFLPLSFGAPVFYSLDAAPRYIQLLSYLNPVRYQVEAMRSAFEGRIEPFQTLIVVIASVLAIAVASWRIEQGELLGSNA